MKNNFFTWWLSISNKPLIYKIWKYTITPIVFIAWVLFIAVYTEKYWQFSLYAVLPIAVVDILWDLINYLVYKKNHKIVENNNKSESVDV